MSEKKRLDMITLCAVDCFNYGEAISSLRKSLTKIEPARSIFLTDIRAYNPKFPFEVIKIEKISSKEEYSAFILKELYKYFATDFVLVTQHDGCVLDQNAWDDAYLEYDFIGAPWLEKDGYNVGNGGFSLRSKKLMEICGTDDFIKPLHPEDNAICRLYRPYLEEKYGIKFAPEELADKFSFELREPAQSTFGYHAEHHKPYAPSVVIKRDAALGDVIMTEPILDYYHKKGYNIYVDMPLDLMMVFSHHNYSITHVKKMDGRIKPLEIDLNMAYENKPKQLHLQSYYEAAGISDGVIRNPKLIFKIHEGNKLFKKYVILHIDKRDQPYRNIYGVDWEEIVNELNGAGYDVIQIGNREHEKVKGAIEFNTFVVSFLVWAIAGADLFLGVDSGPSNAAVALGIKSVIFHGSVNPDYIYPDKTNIRIITKHNGNGVCNTPYCWHESETTTGQDCYVDVKHPPCTIYDTNEVIGAIKDIL